MGNAWAEADGRAAPRLRRAVRRVRILVSLSSLLLAASALAESSFGAARASASTTITISIPVLFGMNLAEEAADFSAPEHLHRASFAVGEEAATGLKLAVISSNGHGRVILSRFVLEQESASGKVEASYRKNGTSEAERPRFVVFPEGAFSWKHLRDSIAAPRAEPASRGSNRRVPTIVYELWQF